jgi:hypothetical protein
MTNFLRTRAHSSRGTRPFPLGGEVALPDPLDDLSHALRQPLTSLGMNLQSLARLLHNPQPQVARALEVLTDCVSAERELVALLARARRPEGRRPAPVIDFALNELAREIQRAHGWPGPAWTLRERFASPSPFVRPAAWALRRPLERLIGLVLRVQDWSQVQARPVLETSMRDDRAELHLGGLTPSLVQHSVMRTLVAHTATIAGQIGGTTDVVPGDGVASIVISMPCVASALEGRHVE